MVGGSNPLAPTNKINGLQLNCCKPFLFWLLRGKPRGNKKIASRLNQLAAPASNSTIYRSVRARASNQQVPRHPITGILDWSPINTCLLFAGCLSLLSSLMLQHDDPTTRKWPLIPVRFRVPQTLHICLYSSRNSKLGPANNIDCRVKRNRNTPAVRAGSVSIVAATVWRGMTVTVVRRLTQSVASSPMPLACTT